MFGPLSYFCCIFGWAFKEFHSPFMVMCYISGIFYKFLARNSCVNVVTQKLCLKLLQNSIKVPKGKLKFYLCRENIDFFGRFEICHWKYRWTFLKIFITFSCLYIFGMTWTRPDSNTTKALLSWGATTNFISHRFVNFVSGSDKIRHQKIPLVLLNDDNAFLNI